MSEVVCEAARVVVFKMTQDMGVPAPKSARGEERKMLNRWSTFLWFCSLERRRHRQVS